MRTVADIIVRRARPEEFDIATDFWAAMRSELAMSKDHLPADWAARALAYWSRRHEANELAWFFACDGPRIVAGATGFIDDGYPRDIATSRRVGYVAGVYVEPSYRRRGLARAVTQAAVDFLWELGCERITLHAAELARPIYESMGFAAGNEMVLYRSDDLRPNTQRKAAP